MLRILHNNRAQMILAEYVVVLFIVVGAVTAMTVFMRRAIQARILGAEKVMIVTADHRSGPHFNGNFYYYYEPYYANTTGNTTRDDRTRSDLASGAFTRTFNTYASSITSSNTASPRFFNRNLPKFIRSSADITPLP